MYHLYLFLSNDVASFLFIEDIRIIRIWQGKKLELSIQFLG